MIDQTSFNELKIKYPFLSDFPQKLQNIISDKLTPELKIHTIYQVSTNGKNGCIFVLEHDLIAYWMSKFLFMKLPTYQEFNFSQINKVESLNDKTIFINASTDPKKTDTDYEDGEFTFQSSDEKEEVLKLIYSKATRLK
jgi:hypothetical protein